jgi:hypothetical protein
MKVKCISSSKILLEHQVKLQSEIKWNISIVYIENWTTASTSGPIEISYIHTLPLHHWDHVIYSKLVQYMSPMAYLGKVFTPKGYKTCYILQGPVFQCEFNRDVHWVIRLTCYGNSSKFIYISICFLHHFSTWFQLWWWVCNLDRNI